MLSQVVISYEKQFPLIFFNLFFKMVKLKTFFSLYVRQLTKF